MFSALMFTIYTVYPLRNDFVMKVISKAQYRKLKEEDKKERNYLVVPSNNDSMKFVLNEYKTKKRYGEKLITIIKGDGVDKPLRQWLKKDHSLREDDSLFYDPVGDFQRPAGLAYQGILL
eukprot:SAG31_NODE_15390_length_757_cov_1.489362_1_plen_120_part_00